MTRSRKPAPVSKSSAEALPLDVRASDLVRPEYDAKDALVHDVGEYGTLTFYNTTAFGWCIATLQIKKSRRSGTPDRTYAARCSDGALVRIGLGPHVTRQIVVYVRESRRAALQRYVELYTAGQDRANAVRDRISSRRAQGVEMRAQGRRSWRWDV
jgi:hypothetical protein